MKTLTRIFAPLAVLGALASCQMYKIDTQMTPEKAAASLRMECSAVDVYTLASQDPDAITFNVSANTPWTLTLSSGADWLDVTPASSAASSLITDVVVIAKSNTSLEDRSATLTLRGENIAKTSPSRPTRIGKSVATKAGLASTARRALRIRKAVPSPSSQSPNPAMCWSARPPSP